MIDWLNPSDDILEARNIGRHDRDVEVESLEAEIERLMVLATRYNDERITAELEVERLRERADRAEAVNAELRRIHGDVIEAATDPTQLQRIEVLEGCIRNARAVIDGMYSMNHRGEWISVAPIVDKAIREIDALLSPPDVVLAEVQDKGPTYIGDGAISAWWDGKKLTDLGSNTEVPPAEAKEESDEHGTY